MTLGIEATVRQVLLALPQLPLVETDVQSDPPVDGDGAVVAYLRFKVVEAPRRAFALARGGMVVRTGFVQVDVMVPRRWTDTQLQTARDTVVVAFPRLTRLGRARVDYPAYASSPLDDGSYNQVPVTVPWRALVEEGVT